MLVGLLLLYGIFFLVIACIVGMFFGLLLIVVGTVDWWRERGRLKSTGRSESSSEVGNG